MKKIHRMMLGLAAFACLVGLPARGELQRAVDETDAETYKNVQKAREHGLQAAEYDMKGRFKAAAKEYLKQSKYEVTRDRRAHALRMAGDAYYSANCTEDAFKTYKKLLEVYPVYVPHSHVLTRLRYIAEKFVRGDGTFLGISDVSLAIDTYELVIREAPAEINTESDRFRLAQLLCRKERYEEAIGVYQAIIQNDHRCWNARAELALLLWKLSAQSDGDGSKLRAAMRETQLVLRYDAANDYAQELRLLAEEGRERTARRIYDMGLFYLAAPHRRKAAARRYLTEAADEYPDTHAGLMAKDALRTNPLLKTPETEPAEAASP